MTQRKVRKSGKLVKGLGINDIDYALSKVNPTTGKQEREHVYSVWQAMIHRVATNATHYGDVSCSDEFVYLSKFIDWYKQQEAIQGNLAGFQLDKDLLLSGNKQYSKEACLFIPDWLNLQFIERTNKRGNFPLGAAQYKKGFMATITDGSGKGKLYLGYYPCYKLAHKAWQEAKVRHLQGIIERVISTDVMKGNTSKTILAIQLRIDKLTKDIVEGVITESINQF